MSTASEALFATLESRLKAVIEDNVRLVAALDEKQVRVKELEARNAALDEANEQQAEDLKRIRSEESPVSRVELAKAQAELVDLRADREQGAKVAQQLRAELEAEQAAHAATRKEFEAALLVTQEWNEAATAAEAREEKLRAAFEDLRMRVLLTGNEMLAAATAEGKAPTIRDTLTQRELDEPGFVEGSKP